MFSAHTALKLEVNNREICGGQRAYKYMETKQLISKSPVWIEEEIKREIREYNEVNENEDMTYQNLQDAAKAVLRVKFIRVNTIIIKEKDLKLVTLTTILRHQKKKIKLTLK